MSPPFRLNEVGRRDQPIRITVSESSTYPPARSTTQLAARRAKDALVSRRRLREGKPFGMSTTDIQCSPEPGSHQPQPGTTALPERPNQSLVHSERRCGDSRTFPSCSELDRPLHAIFHSGTQQPTSDAQIYVNEW